MRRILNIIILQKILNYSGDLLTSMALSWQRRLNLVKKRHIEVPTDLWKAIKSDRNKINGKLETISQVLYRWNSKRGE